MKIVIVVVDIERSADFYQKADVRPPFTYASLIRQVNTFLIFLWINKKAFKANQDQASLI